MKGFTILYINAPTLTLLEQKLSKHIEFYLCVCSSHKCTQSRFRFIQIQKKLPLRNSAIEGKLKSSNNV